MVKIFLHNDLLAHNVYENFKIGRNFQVICVKGAIVSISHVRLKLLCFLDL